MANVCELTGIKYLKGNTVSHANNKTRMRQNPNTRTKRFFIPELNRTVKMLLSAKALRTINKKGGIAQAILKTKPTDLSIKLQRLRRQLQTH